MKSTLFIALLFVIAFANGQGIGSSLSRTFKLFVDLPMQMQDAIDAGWTNYSTCQPSLGIPFTEVSNGPTAGSPVTLYYTAEGQLAGLGVTHFGAPLPSLKNYWQPLGDGSGNAFMSATFRAESFGICDPSSYDDNPIGTQVVINQGTFNLEIPLNTYQAETDQYTEGACIKEMGTHWSYDLETAPVMSWQAENFQPVVPMYVNGSLTAFFFTTSQTQTPEPFGEWEITLPSILMCQNWCGSGCDWDVSWWSTLHFFLDEPSTNTCTGDCNFFHCCGGNSTSTYHH